MVHPTFDDGRLPDSAAVRSGSWSRMDCMTVKCVLCLCNERSQGVAMPDGLLSGELGNIVNFLTAAGALGTAAFGLVDTSKAFRGGVSNAGFGHIQEAVTPFIGNAGQNGARSFGEADILATLRANWINGVAKNEQKAVAKSLIRLGLTSGNARTLAQAAGVDPEQLQDCARRIRSSDALTPEDLNVLGRFDAIVSAVLDEGYERADQQYRNVSKLAAALTAIVLAAIAGGLIFHHNNPDHWLGYFGSAQLLIAILVGAVSTPLAPIAKDLSSALSAAVKAVGTTRR